VHYGEQTFCAVNKIDGSRGTSPVKSINGNLCLSRLAVSWWFIRVRTNGIWSVRTWKDMPQRGVGELSSLALGFGSGTDIMRVYHRPRLFRRSAEVVMNLSRAVIPVEIKFTAI